RVAGDDAEFGADHVVEEYREVARGRAWRARAGDELRGQEIGKRFHRRVAARQADVIVNGGGAEIQELRRVVLDARTVAEQRVHDRGSLQRPDHRAVLGGGVVDVSGGRVAGGARHVDGHDGRIARNVL